MARFTALVSLLVLAVGTNATADACTSNTKGSYPSNPECSASATSSGIQAAECARNTRVSGKQTFAIFKTDHADDDDNGAPYGTCEAYTCAAGSDYTTDADYWTFFWDGSGEDDGVGAACIKDPDTGDCGCEDSDGTFVSGSDSCT